MISIVVPVYNTAPYLSSCLDSILCQTVTDWELILVDDGSTDRSAAICDEYAAKDSRIQVLHQANQGPAKARNLGIAKSQGELVAFIDSDDLLHVQYLGKLLETMLKEDCDIVFAPYVLLGEVDRVRFTPQRLSQPLPKEYTVKTFSGHEAIESMLYQQEVNSSPIKLYRREVLSAKTFPEQFIAYEDLYAMLGIYANCQKICWVDLPIYYYFKRMDGTLNANSVRDSRALEVMQSVRAWIKTYDATLLPAVNSRELSLAFNILRIQKKLGKNPSDTLSGACWQVIRRNRKSAFLDPKMRLKNKLAILLSYLICK